MPRQKKGQCFFDATIAVVYEFGIQGASIAKIAQKAGMSLGNLYNYYSSKEELINAVYLAIKQEESEYMNTGIHDQQDYTEQFVHMWEKIMDYFLCHPKKFMFIEQVFLLPVCQKNTKKEGYECFSSLVHVHQQLQEQGIFAVMDVRKQIVFCHGAIASLIKFHLLGDIQLTPADKKNTINNLYTALATM